MEKSQKNKKTGTVFVSGMFNVLHPGHFRFLNFAAGLGNKLVVGVLSDKIMPNVTVDENERLENISVLSFVDEAFILDEPPQKYIARKKPDIVVKGWEHHNQPNPEKEVIEKYGGRLVFSSGDIKNFSAEDNQNPALQTISKPTDFMKRHDFTVSSLQKLLKKFGDLNVCVLGDIIVDNYVNCQPVGMSREDPTIVVRPAQSMLYLGGAGIVAAHACGLGAQVHFISVCGNDDMGAFAQSKLKDSGVVSHVFIDESRPTTQKKRYRASNKTLLRVNEYSDHPISSDIQQKIMKKLKQIIYDIDVIIFSDFSYGALSQELVDEITKLAAENKIQIAADSQSSSQTGDIGRFKNVALMTPTEHEARLSVNNYVDGLVKLSERVRKQTSAANILITLAEEGLFISDPDNVNDRIPALQSVPVDPAGAGDALLVTSAMCMAAGGSIWQASYLGSLAAAMQVSRAGNIPLKFEELAAVLSQ